MIAAFANADAIPTCIVDKGNVEHIKIRAFPGPFVGIICDLRLAQEPFQGLLQVFTQTLKWREEWQLDLCQVFATGEVAGM